MRAVTRRLHACLRHRAARNPCYVGTGAETDVRSQRSEKHSAALGTRPSIAKVICDGSAYVAWQRHAGPLPPLGTNRQLTRTAIDIVKTQCAYLGGA